MLQRLQVENRYLLVDEFQDSNPVQVSVAQALL